MQDKESTKKSGSWLEVFKTFFWALVIAMVFKSFLFQPFNIPSGSMKPTLLIGDYLIVSKYSYGYSKHSFSPLTLNIFSGRKLYKEPKRGDIVVFKVHNQESGKDVYIKRLIGLPGDTVQMMQGVLYINGEPCPLEDNGKFYDKSKLTEFQRNIETLPNGIKHLTLDYGTDLFVDNTKVYVVPKGRFFMMGDNRDDSRDSRFPVEAGGPGFVPAEDLIGRAEIILFASGESWNPLEWDYKRFFTLLR